MIGNFGKYVKEKRLQLGMSREELANLADTTSTVIYRIETGRENPGKELSERVQKALGVIIDNGWVKEPIHISIECMRRASGEVDAYKEFKSIIRALYSMTPEDLHIVYEFVNNLHNSKRKK